MIPRSSSTIWKESAVFRKRYQQQLILREIQKLQQKPTYNRVVRKLALLQTGIIWNRCSPIWQNILRNSRYSASKFEMYNGWQVQKHFGQAVWISKTYSPSSKSR